MKRMMPSFAVVLSTIFFYPIFVIASDIAGPVAICNEYVQISLDQSTGTAIITPDIIDAGSYDNEGPVTLSVSPTIVDCDDVGTPILVILTVTDTDGNTNQCWSTVIVEDKTVPVAVCYSTIHLSLDASGNGLLTPDIVDAGSMDNCEIFFSLSKSNFDCSDLGVNTIQMYTYNQGEVPLNNCWSDIVVEDKIAPTAVCYANVNVSLDASGHVTLTGAMLDGGSTDNCGVDSYSFSQSDFSCADIGSHVVLMTVSDQSGNTNQCWSTVNIEDKMPPVAVCNATVNLTLNVDGEATLTPAMVDGGSYDNCGVASVTLSKTLFTCADGGSTTVIATVSDGSGNSNQCFLDVVIADSDCDGVADACDVCPGGDDTIDHNSDGIPDCSQVLGAADYLPSWICDNKPGKEKVLLCHNGMTKCFKISQANTHLGHGDNIGPCIECPVALPGSGPAVVSPSLDLDMQVFPNPTSGEIRVELDKKADVETVMLMDLMGKVIVQFDSPSENSIHLDLNSFNCEKGLYLIMAIDKEGLHQSAKVTFLK